MKPNLVVRPTKGEKGHILAGGVLGAAVGALVLGSLSYWYHQQSCEAVDCRERGWQRGVRTSAVSGAVVGGAVGSIIAWARRE